MTTIETEVAVVGAGLAGLSAARSLAAAGTDAVVLEARDRVGGRTVNEAIGDGVVVELGGQWVGPGQDRILELIGDLGLETFPTYGTGRSLFERKGKIRSYSGTIPRVNPVALAEVGRALAKINRMASRVDPEAPWKQDELAAWDRISFDTWVRRNLRTGTARDMMRLAIEAVWAAEPEDVSLLHVLFYIRSAGSIELLLDSEGGSQEARVVGGTQLISLRMAASLGGSVRLNTAVRRISHGPEGVTVAAEDLERGAAVELSARKVIVALPPALAGRLDYDPPLPAVRDGLTQRMIQGSVVKTMAIYPEPFWREDGLCGQAASADGPVSVVFDNSPPGGTPGVLLAFLEGAAARRAADLPQDQRRRIVIECLTRLFGHRAADPEGYVDKAWAADEWSRGCYGGFMPTGAWFSHGSALRQPVGSIHWAGAETSSRWAGYMEGAIRSGRRAATEVTAGQAG
ncbi:MAG: flavin monoamine oxidase family protein [Thermoleophilia bacterium]|nr:flavin monoamine oxidase family protein [Thermoleophilia bacterium]